MTQRIGALSVISGGLDSILATRVVVEEGVDVTAVHFATPFFGKLPGTEADAFRARLKDRYGIDAIVADVGERYIEMLSRPQYGYGRNFNPCVDCKILLFSVAREMMEGLGASFLVTGEVLGQRPMSQRRDTLNVIERDSRTVGILLRPLSAKLLRPTVAEERGWVNRDNLFAFSGRSRKPQIELAARLGITGYPAPAGGCCLTDPIQAQRIRRLYQMKGRPGPREVRLVQIGRPFHLGGGVILSVGRNQGENELIEQLAENGDLFVKTVDIPGPLGLILGTPGETETARAMAIVAHYSKGRHDARVRVGVGHEPHSYGRVLEVVPAGEDDISDMKF
jgi:tRNA-specific 2-thiouridylase